MILKTRSQELKQGVYVEIPLVFDPSNFTQGLGCMGDDGWLEVSGLPPGLLYEPGTHGLKIFGTPTEPGEFTVILDVIGTTEDCSQLQNYYQATIRIEVLLWTRYVEDGCGANSGLINECWLVRPTGADLITPFAIQGLLSFGSTWFDGNFNESAIALPVDECKVEETTKEEGPGTLADIKIEIKLNRDGAMMERLKRVIQGQRYWVVMVDGNGVKRAYGTNDFCLEASMKITKGKGSEGTLALSGQVPGGSYVLDAY